MTRELRKSDFKNGLVLANGGVLTYQHVVCLSSAPQKEHHRQYAAKSPLPPYVDSSAAPEFDDQTNGNASIEVSFT